MTTTEFAKEDLTAIKRAFRTSKATPEEVCLLVRPLRGSGHRLWTKIVFATVPFGSLWGYHHTIATADPQVQAVLTPSWWAALLLVLGIYVVVFFILPRIGLPTFEAIVRPGGDVVTLRGFGFERGEPASLCSFERRKFWYAIKFNSDLYSIRRRWWQRATTFETSCEALNEAFAQARIGIVNGDVSKGVSAQTSQMVKRTNWRVILEEPFVTDDQIAFVLPTPDWYFYFGTLISWGAAVVADIWILTHLPDVNLDVEIIASHLRASPLWLPAMPAFLYVGLVDYLADPWMRRAVAIIPRGQGRIVIRVGKRIHEEVPILDTTFKVSSQRHDIFQPDIILGIHTPSWSGEKGTGLRTTDELWAAIDDLRAFAGVQKPPRIEL